MGAPLPALWVGWGQGAGGVGPGRGGAGCTYAGISFVRWLGNERDRDTEKRQTDRQTERQEGRRRCPWGAGRGAGGEGGSAAPPYSAPWGWESPRPASSHPKTERAPQKEGEHPAPTLARRCAAIGAAFYQLELWGVPAPVWLAPNLGAAFWASFSPVVAPAQTLIPPAGRGWAQRYLLVTALWYSMYVLPSNAMASASPAAFSMITGGGKTGRCHGTERGQARKTSLYPHLPSPGTCQHRASPWRGFTGALGLVNWEQVPVFAAS